MARSFCRKADADTEVRQHTDAAGALKDEVELAGHFQNQHDLQTHFLRVQGKVYKLFILVAVTNDICLGVVHVRKGGDQLGL